MSRSEAISAGYSVCQQRGYRCDLKKAKLTGKDRWKVKFDARRGDARGKLHLEFDAYSRRLRGIDDNVKVRGRSKGKRRG